MKPWKLGTPRDYTTDLYRVYFELGHITQELEALFASFSYEPIVILPHGIEATLPIQVVPDLVRELSKRNEAIYQVVRYAKLGTINKKEENT